MRSFIKPAALLLLGSLVACAGSPPPRFVPYDTPLSWEALEPESGAPIYLLGSIHIGTPDMGKLHPAINQAYERSSELVVEVDLNRNRDGMAAIYAKRAYLPAGDRLAEHVSAETWTRLRAYLAERGLEPEPYARLKPWAVMLRLAGLQFENSGFPTAYGVDRRFLSAAGTRPVVALESYELQLDLYDGFPFEIQEMMLRDFLEPEDPYQTQALVDAWRQGDERTFVRLLFPEADRWEVYRERFFYERNETMARQITELARDGRSRFVVLGVGHMVGPRGIPALLAQHGFEVRRVTP